MIITLVIPINWVMKIILSHLFSTKTTNMTFLIQYEAQLLKS